MKKCYQDFGNYICQNRNVSGRSYGRTADGEKVRGKEKERIRDKKTEKWKKDEEK